MNPQARTYQHILAAIDFSDISAEVLQKALALARLYKARLSVVSVLEDMPVYAEPYGDFSVPMVDASQWEQIQKATTARLEAFVHDAGLPGSVNTKLLNGGPKVEITDYAVAENIDLIIMGSHGHRGVLAMLGSTTDGVIHRASCDVLTVRASPD